MRRQRNTVRGMEIWRAGNEGKGGCGDGPQASDHSLSFLRKHWSNNRLGGVWPLNKYALTGLGLIFGNQVEGINERTPLDTAQTQRHGQLQASAPRDPSSSRPRMQLGSQAWGLGSGYRQAQAWLHDLSVSL